MRTDTFHRSFRTVLAMSLMGLVAAHADTTLLSDDFSTSSVSTTTDGFRLRENNIDDGWQAARQGGGSDWSTTTGVLQNASTVNTNGYPNYIPGEAPVAQAVSLAGLGVPDEETQIRISFDYSVAAGDTLYATFWGHTGTFADTSSNIFANLEARYGLGNNEGSSTLDAVNLLDGATTGFGGTTNPLAALAGDISGTSGTFSATINLESLAIPGVSKVNDLAVLTLGFGKMEDGLAGATSINNLSVVALPPPTSSTTTLLFDDFSASSVSTTTDGFRLRENNIDDGWQAARQGGGSDWDTTTGVLQNASIVNTDGYPNYIPGESPVGQAIAVAGRGAANIETRITISFDYSVAAGDTLYATFWGHTGTFADTSSNIFANLEARYGLANNEGSSTLDAFNLLDGATTGFGGTTNPLATLDGGTSGTFTATIDLATLGIPGVSKVNDLSVLTLGFGKMEDGLDGTTSIDNLSITSSSPPAGEEIVITEVSYDGTGDFVIDFIAEDSTTYNVEVSADLVTPFAPSGVTATTDGSGQGTATVPPASIPAGMAFFRIASAP